MSETARRGRGWRAGIEERNQRRLSAYEVGIVGWRRTVLSKNYSPWAPGRGSRCKSPRSETADVFSKWRRISR